MVHKFTLQCKISLLIRTLCLDIGDTIYEKEKKVVVILILLLLLPIQVAARFKA
jgi:hypothetical protein